MLPCQELKQKLKNWQKRHSFLKEKLLEFKETGEISEETIKELENLQKEIEEFEKKEVKERVEKLKEVWEENKRRFELQPANKLLNLIETQLPLPETPHFLLEKVLNQFLKEFEKKSYHPSHLGTFISGFLNKNIDLYLKHQLQKKKKEEIKEVLIRLDLRKPPLDLLGYKNREKCYLMIKGTVGDWLGAEMLGGTLIIYGEVGGFAVSAFSSSNKGQIWHKGKKIWPKT